MKDREFRQFRAGTARAALGVFGVFGLTLAAVVSLCAQEAQPANPPSGQVVTAYLDYQDASYSFMSWSLPMVLKSSPFKKEPAFSNGKVVRGTWQLGGTGTNEVAFAWDCGARKLYVDLNRNLDLTDDTNGIHTGGRGTGGQTFPGVRLPLQAAGGTRQMLADLTIYDYGSRPRCTAALRSFWQGKLSLQDKEWQTGLLQTPADQRPHFEGGYLLLRPWAERNKPFSVHGGPLAAVPFSRKLFLDDRAYELQLTNDLQGGSNKVRMRVTEQAPSLGELKIAGAYVERATLEGGPYLVVIDRPEGTVKVPVGTYGPVKVWLKKGDAEAYLEDRTQSSATRLTVNEKRPAVLTAGGPLTNSVWFNRRGKNLSLTYRLVGEGGTYQMVKQDRSHRPEFTIYQGDKKIASGKFEFG